MRFLGRRTETKSLRVRFKDLTPYERDIICNGCGPKGWFIPIPDFLFNASCLHHDFNYWLGCREHQRKKADLQFYKEMIRDANLYSGWRRQKYLCIAMVYYRAVRWFGRPCFYYADRQRTRKDLEECIKAYEMKHGTSSGNSK